MPAYPWSPRDTPDVPRTPMQRFWWRVVEHYLTNLSLVAMIALLAITLLYPFIVITVPSGEAAVLWRRFQGGTVLDPAKVMGEGVHLIFPWDQAFVYDCRLQSVAETMNAISRDGVSLSVSMNVRFRVNRPGIPGLHEAVGRDYLRMLVLPEIGTRLREVIATYTAEQVYSSDRPAIQAEILRRTQQRLAEEQHLGTDGAGYLVLYDTLLLGIELPASVVGAIDRKINEFYASEAYDFRLQRERKESLRKQIEAEGIRNFQQTVGEGVSDSYLRLRGIEATVQLAQSTNAKVVIIGGGKDGVPVILNNLDAAPAPAASTVQTAATTPATSAAPAADAKPSTVAATTTPTTTTTTTPATTTTTATPATKTVATPWASKALAEVRPLLQALFGTYVADAEQALNGH